MANVDAAQAEVQAGGLHREHRTAHDVEEVRNAFVLERFRDDIGANSHAWVSFLSG
ncbi:MAG: hypothetical protein R3D68_02190 [Hyphomicrobiaceae bacterium]